ncbi:MAG: hypothetical protein M3N53_03020 [Actinomycetota bacterium]|nr:hypothetical protein [Actinomycetota bacterium]
MHKILVLVLLLASLVAPGAPSVAAAASQQRVQGKFSARALPLPLVDPDVYYLGKGSCLGGLEGLNYVTEPFEAPAAGELVMTAAGFTGDWDIYLVDAAGRRLAQSEGEQVTGADEAEERLSARLQAGSRVDMVACNWLGEPEVEVGYEFDPSGRVPGAKLSVEAGATVVAGGGPAALLWRWESKAVEIERGQTVRWENPTTTTHHVTAYAGSWNTTEHVASDATVEKRFTRPGTYSYRCDVRSHSELVNGECLGMCGEIVVSGRRRS